MLTENEIREVVKSKFAEEREQITKSEIMAEKNRDKRRKLIAENLGLFINESEGSE